MIRVFDDIIPKRYQQEIKNVIFSANFPWMFINDVTVPDNSLEHIEGKYKARPANAHLFKDSFKTSNYFSLISPMIMMAADKAGVEYKEVTQARSFLQHPLNPSITEGRLDPPHIDDGNNHIVFLYYVMDSEGDTIIYNKMYEGGSSSLTSVEDLDIIQKVTPKQGRMVVFDGRYYHTAEQPKENIRCIININVR
jgi:hypothetical protein